MCFIKTKIIIKLSSTLIDFPLNELNLEKYILDKSKNRPIYDLVSVSNHFGSMGGGTILI